MEIESLSTHPGNGGNFDRKIKVNLVGNDWISFKVSCLYYNKALVPTPSHFNISKQAAEELLVALDLMLSEDEDG